MNLYNYTVKETEPEDQEIFVDIYADTENEAKKIAINNFYSVICLNHSIKFERHIEPINNIVILDSYPY